MKEVEVDVLPSIFFTPQNLLFQCRGIIEWSYGLRAGDCQDWTVRFVCGICCLLHVRMHFHGHLWKLYTYIANTCRTDWVQQQSMFNAAQCVLVLFFLACSLLMTLVVSVYIDHCLYHRCFYLDSRVQMHTSFYFFPLYGASSFSVCFFLWCYFCQRICVHECPNLRACKMIMTFVFLTHLMYEELYCVIPVQYFFFS